MSIEKSTSSRTVLVTGGSGFVAGWVIVTLLARGYRVRTTLRSLRREAEIRQGFGTMTDAGDRLDVVVADLLDDAGWDAAMAGVDLVQHVASPMPLGEFRDHDLVGPARDGTIRVLRAADRAGVKRVVLTSSGVAAMPKKPDAHVYSEADWTDPDQPGLSQYNRAKTLAERAAWAFIQASRSGMTLATILPGAIQGPLLTPDLSGWADLITRMLTGKLPMLPRVGMGMVDVRDLAELHVRAMETPEAAGQRFVAAGEFLWFSEVAQALRDGLGADAAKVSARVAPDWLMRLVALGNADLRQLTPNLGKQQTFSTERAQRLLDWQSRPLRQSIVDAGRSILALKRW